jgi:hypothetical protein
MRIEGIIARVTDGPGGQLVVFRYRDAMFEYDHILFATKERTDLKPGDRASVELKRAEPEEPE